MDGDNDVLRIVGYILMTIGIIPIILYLKYHDK